MMKTKIILPLLALVLCMGVFLFPTAAYAQTTDTTPPTLTAEVSGDTIVVQASDDASGVDAIYINTHRFDTLVNGTASVRLGDYAGTGAQIKVYATDVAGNRSQSVLLDNPYYVEPAAQPTATSTAQAVPTASPTPALALPEPVMPEAGEEDGGTEISESSIAGSTVFTPDGGGTVVDNATEEDGKEFFTVTATDGSVYYLVIDRQRGTENVYFLSAVTREDLTSLAEGGAVIESDIAAPTPEPEMSAEPTVEEAEQPEDPAQSGTGGTIIFILLVIGVIGGVGYYVKVVKPRRQAQQEEEYEDDFDEEEDNGEYLFGGGQDKYYHGEMDMEETVDNDGTASYNDTTEEKTTAANEDCDV